MSSSAAVSCTSACNSTTGAVKRDALYQNVSAANLTSQCLQLCNNTLATPDAFDYLNAYDAYIDLVTLFPNTSPVLIGVSSLAVAAGFFVSADGYAVTATHAILVDPTNPALGVGLVYGQISNVNQSGEPLFVQASVVGFDGSADVAILKFPGLTAQTYLQWAYAPPAWLDTIYMLGTNNQTNNSTTFTSLVPPAAITLVNGPEDDGSLAALNRGIVRDPKYFDDTCYNQDIIMTDTGATGLSGTPIIDTQNRVVGVFTLTKAIEARVIPSIVTNVSGALEVAEVNLATTAPLPNTPFYTDGAQTLTSSSNVALVIDQVAVIVDDIILVKDQNNSIATAPNGTNGLYICAQAGSGAAPWILARVPPLESAFLSTNAPFQNFLVVVISGVQNATQFWYSAYPISVVDPVFPAPTTSDSINFIEFPLKAQFQAMQLETLGGGTSQSQAQPIADAIIAVDRDPSLPPVLNGFGMYTQKGWLGCDVAPWGLSQQVAYVQGGQTNVGTMFGCLLTHITTPAGGPEAPIDTAFAAATGHAVGFLTQQVNTPANYPNRPAFVIASIAGVPIGNQNNDEYPLASVLYANPPGSVVAVVLVDVFQTFLAAPVTLQVTLLAMPIELDYPLSGNASGGDGGDRGSDEISPVRRLTRRGVGSSLAGKKPRRLATVRRTTQIVSTSTTHLAPLAERLAKVKAHVGAKHTLAYELSPPLREHTFVA